MVVVAAVVAAEHLQFAGHCWHKLSVAFAGLVLLLVPSSCLDTFWLIGLFRAVDALSCLDTL